MMRAMKDRVSEDIVWAIQEGIAHSYSELHAFLRVYPSSCIAVAVNALCDSGALQLDANGFEIPSAEDRTRAGDAVEGAVSERKVPDSPSVVTPSVPDEGTARASQPAITPVMDDEAAQEPSRDNVVPSTTETEVDAGSSIDEHAAAISGSNSMEDEKEADAAESTQEEESAATMLDESVGSIMTLTPIAFLGLPDHLLRDLHAMGIRAVYELVQRLGSFVPQIGKDRLAFLLKRLSELAGRPPVPLSADDKHQLSILSGSNLIYFDWFGVMCANLSPELSESDIRERLDEDSFNVAYNEAFSFAEFSKIYQQESLVADQKLFEHFTRQGYPVNGDAFHVIMLPTVEEMVDCGAYDSPSELVHEFLNEFTGRKTTENACFGLLRDKFFALKERTDGLGSSERISIGSDLCFSHAAERLAALEPCCVFDEENLTLQCVPSREVARR